MKAKLVALSMAAFALTMAGCSNDENEGTDNWNGEIRLSSGVTVQQTRATGGAPDEQIAANQPIGIYVSKADDETADYTGYSNVSAKADGNGNFSDYSTMYYPQSGKGVKIAAYHPYKADAGDEYDFIVAGDQRTHVADYYNSDLLYSAETEFARSSNACALTFEHKLCKITYTLKAGDGVSSIEGATVDIVNVEKAVKFNRTTGAVTNVQSGYSKKGDVKLGQYGAIIAPQPVEQDEKLLKITLSDAAGGGVFYHKKADDIAFTGGNLYHYTITVNATGLTVTSTITPWGNNPKNGTAEME